jgi:ABC-2 type transport system ATP-binding protein
MPETDAFITGMSAVRMVRLMAELSGLPPREALERAHEALYYVGLGEARYRKVETYSLGMKQAAKLAQAIVHGPKLIFLDEPTNGLDPPHRKRMLDLIKEIRDAGRVHVMLSSHLLRDVEECCDEVLILKEGKLVQYCNLEEERKANLKFIEVETKNNNAAFASAIEGLGCEFALLGERKLKMVLPEGIRIRDLYAIAAERQIQIRRLDYKRDSLQDIFLKAMGTTRGSL